MPGMMPSAVDREYVLEAVRRFEGPLTRYAARLLGDEDAARDVVQEAFLRLCVQERSHVERRLAEWLFTVCRNRALDVLRKEGRMSQLTDERVHVMAAPEPSPPETLQIKEDTERILQLLEGLPPSQREVIRLKFADGFSYKEISRISGHTVSNVGFLIHTGLKTIRGRMSLPVASDTRP